MALPPPVPRQVNIGFDGGHQRPPLAESDAIVPPSGAEEPLPQSPSSLASLDLHGLEESPSDDNPPSAVAAM